MRNYHQSRPRRQIPQKGRACKLTLARYSQVEYASKAAENSGCVLRAGERRITLADHAIAPCPIACALCPRYICLASHSVAIGLRCVDGVVLAVERLVQSQLLVKGANRRIASVDVHVGMVRRA